MPEIPDNCATQRDSKFTELIQIKDKRMSTFMHCAITYKDINIHLCDISFNIHMLKCTLSMYVVHESLQV